MPELPEVETIARSLRPSLIGQRIVAADVRWARTIASPPPHKFKREMQGQIIQDVSRRAKFLHIQLSRSHLFIHLRMSGDLVLKPGSPRAEKHDRLILRLRARFIDPGRGGAGRGHCRSDQPDLQ